MQTQTETILAVWMDRPNMTIAGTTRQYIQHFTMGTYGRLVAHFTPDKDLAYDFVTEQHAKEDIDRIQKMPFARFHIGAVILGRSIRRKYTKHRI